MRSDGNELMSKDTATRPEAASSDTGGGGENRLFIAAVAAVIVATIGCLVLVGFLVAPDGGAGEGAAEGDQVAVAVFPDFHATLVVSPGSVGEDTIDLTLLTHDGSAPPALDGLSVTVSRPVGGAEPVEYQAEPVPGTLGTYTVDAVSFSSPGEWDLAVRARPQGSEPVLQLVTISIGGR